MQEIFPIINRDFGPFQLSKKCEKFIQSATPLQAPFADVILKEECSSLFTSTKDSFEIIFSAISSPIIPQTSASAFINS